MKRLYHYTSERQHLTAILMSGELRGRADMAGAERVGNIRTLDQAHTALLALVDVLRDHDMPPARYHGLLTAVDLLDATLGERSEFLQEQAEEGATNV